MPRHRVVVWSDTVEIETYMNSKSVWIATGKYLDQDITVKDRSPNSAARRWMDAAAYRAG
jgi:hypothetical protein